MSTDRAPRDVKFFNGAGTLAGSLGVPEGSGRAFPGVVLVGGSGSSDRDNDRYFPPIRQHFLNAGFAVLSYDKRGVGESSGDWREATMDDLAADASAALNFLRAQPEVQADAVGLFGHSEGGWVALRAGTARDDVPWVVTNSCPGTTPAAQERYALALGGGFKYLPSDTSPSAYASIDALRAVAGGGFTAAPPTPTTSGAPKWVAQGAFTSGTATKLALTVDDGAGVVKVCSVASTPTATTATLGSVLTAATTAATPSGCVSGVTPSSGTGAITSLNGKANSGSNTWKISVDGSAFTAADRGKVINAGDTIALRWGA